MAGSSAPVRNEEVAPDVRSRLLAEALRLFASRGFDGTSLQDIADVVGIRKASLLYHFGSKEELRLAVLDQLLVDWNQGLPRLLVAAARTGAPRFSSLIGEVIRFFSEDPNRARLLLRESLDRGEDMRARLQTFVAPWVGVVADYIREGQVSGEIHANVDPEAYVVHVVHMIVSGMATASSLDHALLPAHHAAGTPDERHTRELIRMARTSLFRERGTP